MSIEIFEALDAKDFAKAEKLLAEEKEDLQSDDVEGRFWHQNTAVYLYLAQKKIEKASVTQQENLAFAQKLQRLDLEHVALHQLAMVYRERQDYNLALEMIVKERSLLENNFPDDILAAAVNAYEFAYLHFLLGDKEIAEKEMYRSLTLAEQTDDRVAQACAYRGLGEILSDETFFSTAKNLFLQAGDQVGAEEIDILIKNTRL